MNLTRLVYRTPVNIAEKYVYGTHFKEVFLKISNLITLKSSFYHKFESFLQVARKRTNRCRTPYRTILPYSEIQKTSFSLQLLFNSLRHFFNETLIC